MNTKNTALIDLNTPEKVFEKIKDQYSDDIEILRYLDQIDEKSKLALLIAKDHLETSFNLSRSNGYVSYNKK